MRRRPRKRLDRIDENGGIRTNHQDLQFAFESDHSAACDVNARTHRHRCLGFRDSASPGCCHVRCHRNRRPSLPALGDGAQPRWTPVTDRVTQQTLEDSSQHHPNRLLDASSIRSSFFSYQRFIPFSIFIFCGGPQGFLTPTFVHFYCYFNGNIGSKVQRKFPAC